MDEALASVDQVEGPEPLHLLGRAEIAQVFGEHDLALDYLAKAYTAIKTIMQRNRASGEYNYLFFEIARNYGNPYPIHYPRHR